MRFPCLGRNGWQTTTPPEYPRAFQKCRQQQRPNLTVNLPLPTPPFSSKALQTQKQRLGLAAMSSLTKSGCSSPRLKLRLMPSSKPPRPTEMRADFIRVEMMAYPSTLLAKPSTYSTYTELHETCCNIKKHSNYINKRSNLAFNV